MEEVKLNIENQAFKKILNIKNYREVEEFIDANESNLTQYPELLKELGHKCRTIKAFDTQIELYSKYILVTNDPSGLWFRATSYHRLRRFYDAIADFETLSNKKLSERYEPFFSLHYCHCLKEVGDVENGKKRIEKIKTDISPTDFESLIIFCGERISATDMFTAMSH